MKLKFFDLARKMSVKSGHPQHKLGCVVVKKNRIVGVGFNQIKTHTKSTHKFKMLHAEISAIIGSSYQDLNGCDAYVYRERRDGKLGMSKPCAGCELALKLAGIRKVYYTSEEGFKEKNLGG